MIEASFTGDKAGAFFRLWGTAKEEVIKVRHLRLWFQPIDGVKFTVGNNDLGLYTERINWWKVPCGAKIDDFNSWNGRWASGAAVHENFGSTIEITAIPNLYFGLGFSDSAFKFANDEWTNTQWGAVAKYSIPDVGLSIGAAFRDTGKDNWKLITAGADYNANGLYAFVQGKLRMEKVADAYELGGVTIDNFFSYSIDGLNISGTFPVTLRLLEKEVSYMTARLKVSYPVDAVTVYCVVGSNENVNNGPADFGSAVWQFENFGDNFNFYANPGVSFNVGSCSLDIGAEIVYDKPSKTFGWALPFVTKVAF